MISAWLWLLLASIFVYWFLKKRQRTYSNLPPGPKGKPIVGTLPRSGQSMLNFFEELHHQYGDIFMVPIGCQNMVVIDSYALMKEAFSHRHLQGRGTHYTIRTLTMSTFYGLLFASGKPWITQRTFAQKHLKILGMGKSAMETIILEEAEVLIAAFSKKLARPVKVEYEVNVSVLNVIWRLVADERYDVNNKEIQDLTRIVEEVYAIVLNPLSLLNLFPWLLYLPNFVLDTFFETKKAREHMEALAVHIKKIISRHQRSFDRNNIRDFIDHYLLEMEDREEDPGFAVRKDLMDLTIVIFDLISAGTDTGSSTIRWFILYMAVHPDVQRKLQAHIDDVVPRDRLPSIQDRLPYLDAVLAEVHRHVTIAPIGAPHVATETVQVGGYTIPEGTMVIGNIHAVHHDERLFENPEVFRPERFMDGEDNYIAREGFIPFGTGQRQCLGEPLARVELSLICGAVVQAFTISPPEGVTLTTEHDNPSHLQAVVNTAKSYEVVMDKRC